MSSPTPSTDHLDEPTRPLAYAGEDSSSPRPDAVPASQAAGRSIRLVPLVLGVIYLGAVLTWGLVQLDLLRAADLDLVLPAVLVVAGGLGLVASVGSARRSGT